MMSPKLIFKEGDERALKNHVNIFPKLNAYEQYLIIESEGDGRVLNSISWNMSESGTYKIECEGQPKAKRTDPHQVGSDIALGEDGDFVLTGDSPMVHGIDSAIQSVRNVLGMDFGWWANPLLGSYFNSFLKKYGSQRKLVNSIIKLEIVRLLTVPFEDRFSGTGSPILDFINRVIDVQVISLAESDKSVLVKLSLEWGNYEYWEGELKLHM